MASVFAWGAAEDGQLALGGQDEPFITEPTIVTGVNGRRVTDIAVGKNHIIFLLEGGSVVTCGNNDHGQLGQVTSTRKPGCVETFERQPAVCVCAGGSHSLVITEAGQVFAWGDNTEGQLGLATHDSPHYTPKLIKTLASKTVIQVACGNAHCLALTNESKVYSWGRNCNGQMGQGQGTALSHTPQLITSIHSLPIRQVAAGGNHSFALTPSGALFGWGKNLHGNLGLNDNQDRYHPVLCKALRTQKVKYVACGEDHTVVLTQNGGVFTFGLGHYGQLGHSSFNNETLPKRIMELMGSVVTQVACGRQHTIAYVSSRGRMTSFGLGGNGQLGTGTTSKSHNPVLVKGPFMAPHCSTHDKCHGPLSPPCYPDTADPMSTHATPGCSRKEEPMDVSEQGQLVLSVYCGGDQSYCITTTDTSQKPLDFREVNPRTEVLHFTKEMAVSIHSLNTTDPLPSHIADKIELIFGCLGCLNASFLTEDDAHYGCGKTNPGVDVDLASHCFDLLRDTRNRPALRLLISRVEEQLIPSFATSPTPDVEALRIYLILPLCHLFNEHKYFLTIAYPYASAVISLNDAASNVLRIWWSQMKPCYIRNLVSIYKSSVLTLLKMPRPTTHCQMSSRSRHVYICMELLKKIYVANEMSNNKVPCSQFYMKDITDIIDIRSDYVAWVHDATDTGAMSFCDYPFIFNGAAKSLLLQTDALIQMQMAVDEVAQRNLASFFLPISQSTPCLVLCVSRENIIHDTLTQLSKHLNADLKKPLKVLFRGEEAMDAGGVKKEFFMLLIREILDPKYGMFTYHDESRLLWFTHQTFEDQRMFNLVGTLCGLAIYNNTIIDLHFPLALFKKILSSAVTLDDLKELMPSVGRSLQSLLDYTEDDLEEVFILNFAVTEEYCGEIKTIELKADGAQTTVTQDNKAEYVRLYVNYVFVTSVSEVFDAFNQGFLKVCGSRVLELFQPFELQQMVVGNEEYDWSEFEQNAQYKEQFTKDHPTVKMFWTVFHELSVEFKKKFLLFLTGSDRIPILGMKAVPIIIQSVRGGDSYFPVAHTCFNLLDLPMYTDIGTLRKKLLVSLEHTEGFTLV